jgi:APA family basic amino acid/polyamine antiporter
VLGVPALYSAGYGNVGSSIYYALGVVALAVMGAAPIVLFIAGIFFIFTVLTYAEGTTMFPEAGGVTAFARQGFNEIASFIAGWSLLLTYIVTIAISAFTIPPYLGYFWSPLKESPLISTLASMGIIVFLMIVNIIGIKESSIINIIATMLDLITEIAIIILGFTLLFSIPTLTNNMFGNGNWPSLDNLIFGIALAGLAYTGVNTISQMSEETRRPQLRVPRALLLMMITVLVIFSCISTVTLCAMTPQELVTEWARDPIAGIASNLPVAWLQEVFKPLVSILAATILLIATNAGLMGISRLAFSMGTYRQLPATLSQIHSHFKTPYIAIIVFTTIALIILIPGITVPSLFIELGSLYTFSYLITCLLAHSSILSLRIRKPELKRPFKIKLNLKIKGYELPVLSIIGLLVTLVMWIVVIIVQPYSRWIGIGWMIAGLVWYVIYRKHKKLSLTKVVKSE